MEAYCKEVRRLEDKFHGLELNHVARRHNGAADEITKIASSRTMVLLDVFSRDLYKPSIDLRMTEGVDSPPLDPPTQAEAPSTGTDIMQTEGSTLPANLEPDWCNHTSTVSFEASSPWKRLRLDRSLIGPRPLSYTATIRSFIDVALWASYNAVSQSGKARTYSRTYTRGLAVTTWHPKPSSETHSGRVSIGQPRSPTLSR
jgi:hypothetical protein